MSDNNNRSREVSHETSKRRRRANGLCGCGNEPVIAGQNYGLKCHAVDMRKWRAKQKQRIETERAELKALRTAQNTEQRRSA